MQYRFSYFVTLAVAAGAAAAALTRLLVPSLESGVQFGVVAGAALLGVAAAYAVLRVEESRREETFATLRERESRAEDARIRAEFPADLARKVLDGRLEAEEARRRHRAHQRGPDDQWVP